MTIVSKDIGKAKKLLENEEVISIPTETVYGLAGNAFSEEALKSIFRIKNRPFYDPLILHTNSMEKLKTWGLEIPEELRPLAEKYWPGPLTILMNRSDRIPDLVTAGLPRVAIRIPRHPLTLQLLENIDFPLAAPSANPFGQVSPTKAQHVLSYFEDDIDMILDGGDCHVGIESTIVGIEDNQVVVYRLGGLTVEDIEEQVGKVSINTSSSKPTAPGMLIRHYSPGKRVITLEDASDLEVFDPYTTGFILFNWSKPEAKHCLKLSNSNDDKDAARHFYSALKSFGDEESITQIVIQRMDDYGLGRAINDRLQRASAAD